MCNFYYLYLYIFLFPFGWHLNAISGKCGAFFALHLHPSCRYFVPSLLDTELRVVAPRISPRRCPLSSPCHSKCDRLTASVQSHCGNSEAQDAAASRGTGSFKCKLCCTKKKKEKKEESEIHRGGMCDRCRNVWSEAGGGPLWLADDGPTQQQQQQHHWSIDDPALTKQNPILPGCERAQI